MQKISREPLNTHEMLKLCDYIWPQIFIRFTWPAPPLVLLPAPSFHHHVPTFGVSVHFVIVISLQVGVNNGHHFPSLDGNTIQHVFGGGELVCIPGKVSTTIRNRSKTKDCQNVMLLFE